MLNYLFSCSVKFSLNLSIYLFYELPSYNNQFYNNTDLINESYIIAIKI